MNTAVLVPFDQGRVILERVRALYRGFGYAVVFSLVYEFWLGTQGPLEQLVTGNFSSALHQFLTGLWPGVVSIIPGPILAPLAINLPARSRLVRGIYIAIAATVMFVWCDWFAGIPFYSWDRVSVGYILVGFFNTALVVGICAYYIYSRAAADTLMRRKIEHNRLQVELTRAQLQLLQAQIEPHFLFNTLSVVRSLAKSDRAATVVMLGHLIRYFEAALPRLRGGMVSLAQEIELVDAYLAIYRARMGARLVYQISAPSELGRLMIPSMMLLTLVENALKHGVGPALKGGFIHVSAVRQGDFLSLQVADSGAGLQVCQGHGTGLANIRQRLLISYGEKASLSLRVNGPQGVAAHISIPVHRGA